MGPLLHKLGFSRSKTDHKVQYVAAGGALMGIALIVPIDVLAAHSFEAAVLLSAPMGASAVIVFCLPQSPLGQPWNVVIGNLISACVGVVCAKWIALPEAAAAIGMFGAVIGMVLTRSLHPPGGAVVLPAILSGPPIK